MVEKPRPIPNADTMPFWEACNRHELIYQFCRECDHRQFYPRRMCKKCGSHGLEWVKAPLRGKVYSFTIQYRAPMSAFREDVPYVIALIDLDDDIRMMMNIKECRPEEIHIGMPVSIIFEQRGEQKIPQAMPFSNSENS